jgi:hypothetical protein
VEPAVRGEDVHGSGWQCAAAEGDADPGCAEIGVRPPVCPAYRGVHVFVPNSASVPPSALARL